jgi:hypothetical protein
MDVPLEILDREVARASADLDGARARLARGEVDVDNPLEAHRRVSSRATLLDLAGLGEPLAAPLRDWILSLTLERVLWPDTLRRARAWRAPSITVATTGIAALTESPREMLLRTLREADPARRRVFADALAGGAVAVQDAARILADRRVEAARQLGGDLGALEIPVDLRAAAPATGGPGPQGADDVAPPPASLAALAARLLADTAALVDRGSDWAAALAAGVGGSLGEGWPARLGARWLFDLFRKGPLTEGLRPALPPLPAAIGAASFARALGAFGAALADADGPRGLFARAWAPFDLRRARRSALFAGLAADPLFAGHALGLGRDRARDQARGVARALLVTLRLDAARVLCRGALSLPGGERASLLEEHTAAAIGVALPPSLAGVVPRLGPDDPMRLAGALLAARDRRALVDRFDDDWFRSPHAAHALREEDATLPGPEAKRAPLAALAAGLAEIVRVLGELS